MKETRASTAATWASGTFLVDAHVHCHAGVPPADFLASAARNFAAGAAAKAITPSAAWLLFTETAQARAFAGFAENEPPAGWTIAQTREHISLVARPATADGLPLVLVAGRQILAAEGLEVLAIGAPGPFADGLDLAASMAAVAEAGGLVVLPWGFGKWWGRRGAILEAVLEAAPPGTLFLGDNAGRPQLATEPAAFARAAAKRMWVLPGSDSLPLPEEAASTAGRYGFVLEGQADPERPAAWLKAKLSGLDRQPERFGRRQGLLPFVRRQVAMQLRKRRAA